MQTGFQTIPEGAKRVYYNNQGHMQYGQQRLGNYWYLFDRRTGALQVGFQTIPEQQKRVYYNNQGQMQYGQQQISGYWYLFNKDTGAMQTGFQNIPEQRKRVYYNNAGQMQYGEQHLSNYWYLFNQDTGAMLTGFQTIPGTAKRVYYDNQGHMQYGQQKLGGYWYLFDKNTGAIQTGFQNIPEQQKRVYYNNDGWMQYGQQRIGGYWYLFDKNTGAMQTGFQNIPEQQKRVYYNSDGQMQYGWQVLAGKRYYFNKDTDQMTVGRQNIDNLIYIFNSDGVFYSDANISNMLGTVTVEGDMSGISKENKKVIKLKITLPDQQVQQLWATIKWRGDSSLKWVKKGYRIKLFSDDKLTQEAKIKFGDGWLKTDSFNLKSNYVDPTMGTNVVNAALFKRITDSRSNLSTSIVKEMPNYGQINGFPLELIINGNDQGVYTLNTHNQAKLYKLDDDTASDIAIIGDYWDNATEFKKAATTVDDFNHSFSVISPDKVSQATADRVSELNKIANAKTDNEYYQLEQQYLDVPAAIDFIIFSAAIDNTDGTAKNTTYISTNNSKWVIMPYDLDTSWNNNWTGKVKSVTNNFDSNIALNNLLQQIYTHHKTDLLKRYSDLRKGVLSTASVQKMYADWFNQIGEANYKNNDAIWPEVNSGDVQRKYVSVSDFANVIATRLSTLDKQWKI